MNHSGESHQIILAKVGALLAIGILSFFCGILPHYSVRSFKNRFPTSTVQKITSGFVCFSGGTLLGVTFLHLMPEVREKIVILQTEYNSLVSLKNLPLSDIIAMSGFFGVYLLDELLHMWVEWYAVRVKQQEAAKENVKGDARRVCTQLPHEVSVFSLDSHEASKHHVAISRRSNHHTLPLPSCVCQSKSLMGETVDEKELGSVHEVSPGESKTTGTHRTLSRPTCTNNVMPSMSGLITIAALSFHEIFEGVAIGIEQDLNSILFLYLSIASHKYAIAFCIGMDLVVSGSRFKLIVFSMMVFSVVSPIGVLIGMVVVSENVLRDRPAIDSPGSVIMQGLAGGTLIYVVCFEVLQREVTESHKNGIQNVIFVICGFLVTLVFKCLTGHSHYS